jgi:hypothetical protein
MEAAELVAVGTLTSLLSAMLVLGLVRVKHFVDPSVLSAEGPRYLVRHPFRGFGGLAAMFALSSAMAFFLARVLHRSQADHLETGTSVWYRVLWKGRPTQNHLPLITVDLKDGRRVVGVLRTFTASVEENRELALSKPIAAGIPANGPLQRTKDEFVILREEEIASVSGVYRDLVTRDAANAGT